MQIHYPPPPPPQARGQSAGNTGFKNVSGKTNLFVHKQNPRRRGRYCILFLKVRSSVYPSHETNRPLNTVYVFRAITVGTQTAINKWQIELILFACAYVCLDKEHDSLPMQQNKLRGQFKWLWVVCVCIRLAEDRKSKGRVCVRERETEEGGRGGEG